MKKIILFLLIACLMLAVCSCKDDAKDELENKQTTAESVDTSTVENGDTATTTTPEETGTESPDPENDPYWTENY